MVVPLAIGVAFANTLKFAVEPRQLSRFYALESRAAAWKSLWVSTLAFLVVYSLLIPVGLYARTVVPGLADTDHVVPALLTTPGVFSAGASAFLLLAMVAAAMSSLDSVLLVMASTAERDVAGFFRKAGTDRSVLSSTRIYVALFALVTALIALNPPTDIVSLTAFSGAVYGACFGPSLILGLHWRRGNGAASATSFIVGLAVLLSWDHLPWTGGVHQVFRGSSSRSWLTGQWRWPLRRTSRRRWTGSSRANEPGSGGRGSRAPGAPKGKRRTAVPLSIAELFATALRLYAVVGALFAVPFAWRGRRRAGPGGPARELGLPSADPAGRGGTVARPPGRLGAVGEVQRRGGRGATVRRGHRSAHRAAASSAGRWPPGSSGTGGPFVPRGSLHSPSPSPTCRLQRRRGRRRSTPTPAPLRCATSVARTQRSATRPRRFSGRRFPAGSTLPSRG